MSDYEQEKWVEFYHCALLELEHARMAGLIGDARTEIAARIEKLCELPGLHDLEQQALRDALDGLRALEQEDARYEKNERRIAELALEKLRMIAPKNPPLVRWQIVQGWSAPYSERVLIPVFEQAISLLGSITFLGPCSFEMCSHLCHLR